MFPMDFWRNLLFISSFVLILNQASCQDEPPPKQESVPPPQIYSLHINSDIKYRYAQTAVVSRIANTANVSQEVFFHLVLPETAFITGFLMRIKEKDYKAYVKEKEEAKQEYVAAVNAGLSAAHVAYSARDSNEFTVSVNIEPLEKVTFNLTYEDFLKRSLSSYKHEINVSPGQVVKDLQINVDIEDAFPITDVRVPNLRTNNEILESEEENQLAKIERSSPNSTKVHISWSPPVDDQKKMSKDGAQGQFVVYYDVDRTNKQQVLMDDGYFVHFYAADDLEPLNKHVVFVLDVSGSMGGRKLNQLKDAMDKILSDMRSEDYFSIVLFSEAAKAWAPNQPFEFSFGFDFIQNKEDGKDQELSSDFVILASKENVALAKSFVRNMTDYGGTNIIAGIRAGIKLARIGSGSLRNIVSKPQPILIFLTDGEPNVEVSNPQTITQMTIDMNALKVPIFSLAFGSGADINFLRNLSLTNLGFARTIYEAADATLQLKNFFKAVSSPLLYNVTFEYLPGQVETSAKKNFNLFFSGSELVVVGKSVNNSLEGKLVATSKEGLIETPILIDYIIPPPEEPKEKKEPGRLERLWAYQTIKNLLDENTAHSNETIKKQALDIALKYSFVTPVTSLVVVKPNETKPVDTTASAGGNKPHRFPTFAKIRSSFASHPVYSQPLAMSGFNGAAPAFGALPPHAYSFASSPVLGLPGPPPQNKVSIQRPSPHFATASFMTTTYKPYAVGGTGASSLDHFSEESLPQLSQGDFSRSCNISEVTWISVEEGDSLVVPPSNVTTDVISLSPADSPELECMNQGTNSTGKCRHFVQCILPVFLDDSESFLPYKCHIEPNFLGVCCPF